MTDSTISASKMIALVGWGLSLALLVLGWNAHIAGHESRSTMFGLSAAWSSAVAAVLQIRCWTIRVCTLVRLCAETGGGQDVTTKLHALR